MSPVNNSNASSNNNNTALWIPLLKPKDLQRVKKQRKRLLRPLWTRRSGLAGKTLWDFLQLLVIPIVIAGGGWWFVYQQGMASRIASADQQQETALQTYLDRMSDLLLTDHLATSPDGDEVREVARERTHTLLPQLNSTRKGEVIKFLYEAGLLQGNAKGPAAVNLDRDDLSGANLQGSNLGGVNLSHADLSDANVSYADLTGANLFDADLTGANLTGANLAKATMPDGTKHP
jgi:hypothetical protein